VLRIHGVPKNKIIYQGQTQGGRSCRPTKSPEQKFKKNVGFADVMISNVLRKSATEVS
jgi:hypothetical protein